MKRYMTSRKRMALRRRELGIKSHRGRLLGTKLAKLSFSGGRGNFCRPLTQWHQRQSKQGRTQGSRVHRRSDRVSTPSVSAAPTPSRTATLANPWFRLYSEFADDPKVQMLTEAMHSRLVMLMCFRCKDASR
jgi:hypothetical protein